MANAIITKYVGATDTKPSKFVASDANGNKVSTSYDYSLTAEANHYKAACELRDKMGWKGELIGGSIKGGYALVFVPASA